jgi:hypothetical protein
MLSIDSLLTNTGSVIASYVDYSTEAQSGRGSEMKSTRKHLIATSIRRILEAATLTIKSFWQPIQSWDLISQISFPSASSAISAATE